MMLTRFVGSLKANRPCLTCMGVSRRYLSIILISILFVSTWSTQIVDLSVGNESYDSQTNTEQTWNQQNQPIWDSGWTPQLWQPQPTGALWEVDFSPNGEMIAAVDISTNHLTVWNTTDGRTIFYAEHANSLVDVMWLDNSHVLAADGTTHWYSYQITDDGGNWPMNSTTMRTGSWTDDLSGSRAGWLWGIDTTPDRSRIVFCGDIDDPNIGGEIVVADTAYFINGSSSNSAHVYSTSWGTDCAIANNGTFVASLNRIYDSSISGYRDTVTGWEVLGNTLAQTWNRNVAGGESMAWAVDFNPNGQTYTIAYNRPTEGVVTDYFHTDGTVNWYTTLFQNVSSLRWTPDATIVNVGLHSPGRILTLDHAGAILSDYGWHSTIYGGKSYPSDVTSIAVNDQSTQVASAGKDGSIEIYNIDMNTLQLNIYRRLSANLLREITIHPLEPFVAFAESSGTATVRDTSTGQIMMQCFHPDFGQPIGVLPFAKSIIMHDFQTIVGFSDGVIVACGSDGKKMWDWRIDNYHPIEVFGRIAIHPVESYLAISWTQNQSLTGVAGKVSILDINQMVEVKTWDYLTEYWAMKFSFDGAWLASTAQDGSVRFWQTDDPMASLWNDDGVHYSHGNYTGALFWHPALNIVMTAGWDSNAIIWDADLGQQMLQFQFTDQAFGATFIGGSFLVVASGDAGTSQSGQVEFYDGLNMTQIGAWSLNGIPRGLAMPSTNIIIVANHTNSWWVLIPDGDGDGIVDSEDHFPNNPLQWVDTDGDGFGDNNAPGAGGDGCPTVWGTSSLDRGGCPDTDGDQWSDPDEFWPACVLGAGFGDAWISNPEQWCDTDGDGYGDEYLYIVDENTGLRMNESGDAFPDDATQWRDQDGDNTGDNYTYTLDSEYMRINEMGDAFPEDPLQNQDTDGDGWGNYYTYNTGMDGLRDEIGDAFFLDSLAWSDLDGDGCPTDSATGLTIDNHPEDPTRCDEELDFDLPGQLHILGVGSDTEWTIYVDWKTISESTDRIKMYGASWNSTQGLGGMSADLEPPGAMPWREWHTFSGQIQAVEFTHNRQDDNDRLTLRFIAWSNDEQMLEVWHNFTYEFEVETPPVEPPIDHNVPDDNSEQNITETDEESSGSSIEWMMLAIVVVILISVTVFVVITTRSKKRGSSIDVAFDDAPPASGALSVGSIYPPCSECGGPAHETIHNGDRWTWCPSCRKWLSYLGKV